MSEARPILLVVDDERANLESLERIFAREGLDVRTADSGEEALDLLRQARVNVLLTDLRLPGLSGVDLLRHCRTLFPETEVILMTAFGTVETAVTAMKEGAYDYITKPFKKGQVVKIVRQALERQSLVAENRALKAELDRMRQDREVVGHSLALRRTLDLVHQAAPANATVLLEGESGTGKELLARMLHTHGLRKDGPFVAVNLAALPDTIVESELFGHERGAFTGATARRDGRFSLADGGTLFLDEVAEVSPQVQVKLLRVLQEGEFERVGSATTQRVDARIVSATNRDLREEVSAGRFREDLFYRLNIIHIRVPPLRERREDVPLLAKHFLLRFAQDNRKDIKGFQAETLECLEAYPWPGNVRELQGVIERAVVLSRQDILGPEDLPEHVRRGQELRSITIPLGTALEDIEQQVIRETLRLTRGDKRRAAQLLGIATRTIYRKLERI